MAVFKLEDYLSIGVVTNTQAASWEVATDPDFENIIASTYNNREAVEEWHTELKKSEHEWYEEDDILFVRVKIHTDIGDSSWYNVTPDKSYLKYLWINQGEEHNPTKTLVGTMERNTKGEFVIDIKDQKLVNECLKEFRKEEYRDDY